MALFCNQIPLTFRPINDPHFHQAIIMEFNKPNRKKVFSWFVLHYVGDLQYMYSGRRIVAVHKNYGTSYFDNQRFFSGSWFWLPLFSKKAIFPILGGSNW